MAQALGQALDTVIIQQYLTIRRKLAYSTYGRYLSRYGLEILGSSRSVDELLDAFPIAGNWISEECGKEGKTVSLV